MYNYCLPLLYFVLRFYKAVNKVLSYNLIYKDDNVKTHFVRFFGHQALDLVSLFAILFDISKLHDIYNIINNSI